MRFRDLLTTLSVVALTAVLAASGCDRNAQLAREQTFEALDANHDNLIDAGESDRIPALNAAFDRVDVNHRGNLDQPEFETAMAQIKEQQAGHG